MASLYVIDNFFKGNGFLAAGCHIAHDGLAVGELVVADDDGVARVGFVGCFHLRFHAL